MQMLEVGRTRYREPKENQVINFPVYSLGDDGNLHTEYDSGLVEGVRGGGYFGRVILLKDKDFVIKTSQPGALPNLLRLLNWRLQRFPHCFDERAAQLEHISTTLIHEVLPVLSEGRYSSPASYGYTRTEAGFGQLVERIHGRPIRFDTENDEYSELKEAQRYLTRLAYELGLESVGQVHDRNPFALANLWKDLKTGNIVWLDTIPAMRHSMGKIFKFQKEIMDYFETDDPTFNTIHTEKFREKITRESDKFSPQQLERINRLLRVYDEINEDFVANPDYQTDISGLFLALAQLSREAEKAGYFQKLQKDPSFRRAVVQTCKSLVGNSEFRSDWFYSRFVTRGVEKARRLNIITEEEYDELIRGIRANGYQNKKVAYATAQGCYIASGFVGDFVAGTIGLDAVVDIAQNAVKTGNLAPEDIFQGAFAFIVWKSIPAMIRPLTTRAIARKFKVDMRIAEIASAIPLPLMTYFIIPIQAAVADDDRILHYQIRWAISKMTSPLGGEGSEAEARLWKILGVRLFEKIRKYNSGPQSHS